MTAGASDGTSGVIVNYNGGAGVVRCVESLRRSDFGARPLLVVDNASHDGSPRALRERFPDVELLQLPQNVGFAAAVNRARERLLARAGGPILVLNPDTEVASDFFAPLAQALADGAALAGPKLLLPGAPRRIWSAGGAVTFGRNLCVLRGHREPDRGQHDRAEDVSFLPGTAWLAARRLFEEVGRLDDGFFCYVEDVDFCVRAQERGARMRYEPRSIVVHEGSAASGGGYTALRKYLSATGAWRLLRKHGTPGRWIRFLAGDVATLPFALAYGCARGRPGAALWKARGLLDGWRRRPFDAARRAQLLPGPPPAPAGAPGSEVAA
jgi:GT2 family glycosyltransferase